MTRATRQDGLVALFLDMLAAERGASANTLAAYTRDLDDLLAHLRSRARDLSKATTDDLRDYLVSLSESGFKASSVARRLSAIRQRSCGFWTSILS